jgi:hypothetical protein
MASSECEYGFEFECDTCHNVSNPPRVGRGSDKPDFMFCWNVLKDRGWKARKGPTKDGKFEVWRHYCPRCSSRA